MLFSTAGGDSLRHSPWLLARLGLLLQAVEDKLVVFKKIKGTANPVNSLTKYTPKSEFWRDMRFLANQPEGQTAAAGQVDEEMADVKANLAALIASVTADMCFAKDNG